MKQEAESVYYYYYEDADHLERNITIGGHALFKGNSSSAVLYYYGDGKIPEYPSRAHYVEMAVLVLLCLIGLIGNVLVIFVIARQKSTKKVTYLYLTNLAVVNVLYLVACVPVYAVSYALTHWPFGGVMCKLSGYVTSVCLAVNVLTLTITGLDRYLAVLHPVRSRSFRTDRNALLVIAAIWTVSLTLLSPRLYLYSTMQLFDFEIYTICSRHKAGAAARRLDSSIQLVTMYLLPLLVLGFCHLKIALLLWRSRRPGLPSQEISVLALKERRRIARIVFALTLAFAIGWLPLHIIHMYEDFNDRLLFDNRQIFVLGFSFGANAINPFLYCLLSKHFRKQFKRVFACRRHGGTASGLARRPNLAAPTKCQSTRANEEILVIDLENDADGKDNDITVDGVIKSEALGDSTEKSTVLTSESNKQEALGLCTNMYVPMATERPSAYLQLTPSRHLDSGGHDSSGDQKTVAYEKWKSAMEKTLIVPTTVTSNRCMVDHAAPALKKKLVTFDHNESDCFLPRVQ